MTGPVARQAPSPPALPWQDGGEPEGRRAADPITERGAPMGAAGLVGPQLRWGRAAYPRGGETSDDWGSEGNAARIQMHRCPQGALADSLIFGPGKCQKPHSGAATTFIGNSVRFFLQSDPWRVGKDYSLSIHSRARSIGHWDGLYRQSFHGSKYQSFC